MNKIITLTCALSLLAAGSVAHAAKPSRIVANDRTVLPSVSSMVENGRTLVPLRVVAEALGASVTWDAKKRTANVSKWAESTVFKAGSKTATAVYGSINPEPQTVALDTAAVIQQGRVYVPLRMIAVTFGYQVDFTTDGTIALRSFINKADRAVLASGELSDARLLVRKKGVLNAHFAQLPTLYPSQGREGYAATFLFPVGEANRFFFVSGDTAAFYELIDGFFVVTWRALIPLGSKDALGLFLDGKYTEATGTYPAAIEKKGFVYNTTSTYMNGERHTTGTVDKDGTINVLGTTWSVSGELKEQSGSLDMAMPGETRNEVRLP